MSSWPTSLARLLDAVDHAMFEEGIDPDVRDRVVARLRGDEPTEPRQWAEPLPRDLAVVEMLADGAPACVRARPTWSVSPVNG